MRVPTTRRIMRFRQHEIDRFQQRLCRPSLFGLERCRNEAQILTRQDQQPMYIEIVTTNGDAAAPLQPEFLKRACEFPRIAAEFAVSDSAAIGYQRDRIRSLDSIVTQILDSHDATAPLCQRQALMNRPYAASRSGVAPNR